MTKKEEQEYLVLLDLLFRVSAGTKRVVIADPNRLRDAEGLAVKFAFHSASIFYLTRGTIIEDFPSEPLDFVGVASIRRDFQDRLSTEFDKSLQKLIPLKRKIGITDHLIDQIVYKLYGLTEAEIEIVEGRPKR